MKIDLAEIHRRRRWLQQENRKYPEHPIMVPVDQWPTAEARTNRISIWRSRDFLIQTFLVSTGLVRMSVCRAEIDDRGNFLDGISWEELQRLKNQCGFADKDAVEIFPRHYDAVNVANMRHLWIMDDPVSFAWRSTQHQQSNNGAVNGNLTPNQNHELSPRRF